MTTHPTPAPADLRNTLEEMRAQLAADGARAGLAGKLQKLMLRLLEMLMALLLDLRAGRLTGDCADAARGGQEAPGAHPIHTHQARGQGPQDAGERDAFAPALPSPQPIPAPPGARGDMSRGCATSGADRNTCARDTADAVDRHADVPARRPAAIVVALTRLPRQPGRCGPRVVPHGFSNGLSGGFAGGFFKNGFGGGGMIAPQSFHSDNHATCLGK